MATINKEKINGVVYTPQWIVKSILDLAKFEHNIYNKKVIDPACGDGAFLTDILHRMILDAQSHGIDNNEIHNIVSNNIYGFDIDANAIKQCKKRLSNICKEYKIYNPKTRWKNIKITNTLSQDNITRYKEFFDFVFGNPPYVRIQNLNKKTRKVIDKNFKLCDNGSTDIYIAFFELGYGFMKDTGKLGYITPNSFIKSAAGKSLRQFFANRKNIDTLVNFEHHQVFSDATTYSIITTLDNTKNSNIINLLTGDASNIDYTDISPLDVSKLNEENWVLKNKKISSKIDEIRGRGTPLGKLCNIHTGIATLADSLYIFKNPIIEKNKATISLKDGRSFTIEAAILKKIIKASTWKSSNDDQNTYIIFPYAQINGKHSIIPEEKLKKKYPLTYKYFLAIKNELLARDKGKPNPVSWYAFGRSQGLDTAFGKKIITAPINLNPRFLVCEDEDTLYYAGYSIKYNGDLNGLAKKLNSNDMKVFIEHTSRDYQGGYKSYAKSFIKDFGVII